MEASPLTEAEDALLKEGIQEFDSTRYWHAHESWEDLWNSLKRRKAPRSEILGIQGLIQTAALLYNHQREKKRGVLCSARRVSPQGRSLMTSPGAKNAHLWSHFCSLFLNFSYVCPEPVWVK